jgi:DNA-directed RNA polymerase specialized sigma24 family protein
MDDRPWLAQRLEMHRAQLRGVAYRMLSSVSEADDAVQEAWIRLSRTDTSDVDNLRGWLTRVVVALNILRVRKFLRETPLEVHVPDPHERRSVTIELPLRRRRASFDPRRRGHREDPTSYPNGRRMSVPMSGTAVTEVIPPERAMRGCMRA